MLLATDLFTHILHIDIKAGNGKSDEKVRRLQDIRGMNIVRQMHLGVSKLIRRCQYASRQF